MTVSTTRSQRPFLHAASRDARHRSSMKAIPRAVAIADVSAMFAYILGFNSMTAQVVALVIKAMLVLTVASPARTLLYPRLFSFAFITAASLFSLAVSRELVTDQVTQVAGFIAHLGLSLVLLKREQVHAYTHCIAYVIALAGIIYIPMATMGFINDHFGRMLWFNDNHPNLGSEFAVVGIICAALSLPLRNFALVTAPSLVGIILMEGRSALLAAVLTILLKLWHFLSDRIKARQRRLQILSAICVAAMATLGGLPYIMDALQLDHEYRGTETGLSGRLDRWLLAWQIFKENPLAGIGLRSFVAHDIPTPHNFFLFGLAEMGIIFAPILFVLIYLTAKAATNNGARASYLLPAAALLVLNDRFLNLNPYPFVLLVLLFALSLPLPQIRQAPTLARSTKSPAHEMLFSQTAEEKI